MYSNENAIGMFDKMVELGDYYSSGRVVYVYPEIIINDICSKVPVQKNDVILDVGCGTGLVTIPLAQKCKHVYAVDASEKVLMSLKLNCKKEKITNVEFHRVIVPICHLMIVFLIKLLCTR